MSNFFLACVPVISFPSVREKWTTAFRKKELLFNLFEKESLLHVNKWRTPVQGYVDKLFLACANQLFPSEAGARNEWQLPGRSYNSLGT